jgi:hypothetical protein
MPFNDAGQPDFTALFFETFAAMARPIVYEVRRHANRPHDMQFLSSLLHDARFRREDIVEKDGMLTFPLQRDRWEDNPMESEEGIWSVDTTLVIGPVISQEWAFGEDFDRSNELLIVDIRLQHAPNDEDRAVLQLCGDTGFWHAALIVDPADLRIHLQDSE